MKRERLLVLLGSICLVLALVAIPFMAACAKPAPPAPAPAPQKFVWRYQCPFPKADSSYYITSVTWAKDIERITDGRITLELYAGGEIVPPLEQLTAVSRGVLDAGYDAGGYTIKDLWAMLFGGFPGAWTNIDDAYTLIYEKGVLDIIRKACAEQHNVYLLSIAGAGGIYAYTTFPVHTLDDFKGKKMHAPGPRAPLFKNLGASVVTLPGGELYMGMKLGTIDGFTFTGTEIEAMKFKEVTKYLILPALYRPVNGALGVNLDKWNELPDDLKEILNKYSRENYKRLTELALDPEDGAFEKAKAYGVEFITLSEAEQKKLSQLGYESVLPWMEEDKIFAQGVEIVKAYYAAR